MTSITSHPTIALHQSSLVVVDPTWVPWNGRETWRLGFRSEFEGSLDTDLLTDGEIFAGAQRYAQYLADFASEVGVWDERRQAYLVPAEFPDQDSDCDLRGEAFEESFEAADVRVREFVGRTVVYAQTLGRDGFTVEVDDLVDHGSTICARVTVRAPNGEVIGGSAQACDEDIIFLVVLDFYADDVPGMADSEARINAFYEAQREAWASAPED
ncbi:hypothetical protein [Cryobacterium sp. Y29]|uniref:hypothetical protein n=1 Tax=Cryobacterium sp. Y29 TaxID=2048285 RepID=UPI000CE4E309|nr:hypothetical protein [Cryobacterium sp. Y29]